MQRLYLLAVFLSIIILGMPVFAQSSLVTFSSNTTSINALLGGTLSVQTPYKTVITVSIPVGTYAKVGTSILSKYNLTLATFNLTNVPSPAANYTPKYAFALEVNRQINSTGILFANASGKAKGLIATSNYPSNWTTWAYLGGNFSGTSLIGGSYAGTKNTWAYNQTNGLMQYNYLTRPIAWIILSQPVNHTTTTTIPVPVNSTTTSPPSISTVSTTVQPSQSSTNTTSSSQTTTTSSLSSSDFLIAGIIIVVVLIIIVAALGLRKKPI